MIKLIIKNISNFLCFFNIIFIIFTKNSWIKMFSTKTTIQSLVNTIKYNKISYQNGNPYNVRWQYKWRHAYYTYPKDTYEHTRVKKPEDTP
jgi:hypothetical protein